MISRETINQVREQTDIVALIESKGVALTRAGSRYKGLCPVHSERSPSFNVNPDSQTYHCFGCGASGDAIAFVQEVDGYNFTGAVEYLAEEAGIVVENTQGEDPDYMHKKDYLRCVGAAAHFFRTMFANLPEDHPAKTNLAGRNYLHVEGRETWLEDFGMGYAPDGFDMLSKYLVKQGFTEDQIIDAGLAFRSDKTQKLIDRFRHRLLWEIRNIQGKPIGFSGRRLREEDNPKYLNTSQTILYNKSKVLYGLDLAKKKIVDEKTCYVVEGAADVMALAAVGKTNTVASCGTAFGSDHAAIIRRMIDDFDSQKNGRFVFVFDGDAAGVKAATRVFDIKPSIRDRSYVVSLPQGDPVEFRLEEGDEALLTLLEEEQVPITEFMIRHAMKNHDLTEIEGRQSFVKESMAIIASIDEIAIYESYRRKIAFLSGVPMEHLPAYQNRARAAQDADPRENHDYFVAPTESVIFEPAQPAVSHDDFPVREPEPEYHSPDAGYYDDTPPPDYEEGEYPPDDYDGYNEYSDTQSTVPAQPVATAPVTPSADVSVPTPVRKLSLAEWNEKSLLAAFFQFPNEVFPVLRQKDAATLFTNNVFQAVLFDAMIIAEDDYDSEKKIVFRASDFNEENLVLELFHMPMVLDRSRAAYSAGRLITTLEKLGKRRHNESLKSTIAQGIAFDNPEDLSLLEQFVNNRKK
ncbi:MAG: DNA primase [Enterococcus sp.]|nr:DNA primase [Enterococcus sp.]